MSLLEISLDWCWVDECYKWLNNVNNAFHNITAYDIYTSYDINVKVNTWFIPWKILVLLWYHLDILNSKSKRLSIYWLEKFSDFIEKCWLVDFVNNQSINYNILKDSVIIPFCKVPEIDTFEKRIEEFFNRTNISSNTANIIAKFLWELHNNSLNHGHTNKIYITWQQYPNISKYDISIYDDWEWININKNQYIDLVNRVSNDFIEPWFKEYIKNKIWLNVFFIILCVSTRFSTKWPRWWLWLYELSKFLSENNWCLHIASWIEYIDLKFTNICDILKSDSLKIENKKLNHEIKWTYISFTFSI